jgi:ABC-type Fe3+/spermidine/putrescine transport system ATPase subunit
MDPYLLKLAITMMNKFNEYELLNGVMNKIQILAIQIMHNKEILSQKTLAMLNDFITKYNTAKDAYFTAKKIYEAESIEIAKEAAEAKNRTEASTRPHRTFLPLQNGTFGYYGLPTEQSFNPKWL